MQTIQSGLYIVTLNNSESISVNAQDPRCANRAIKVNSANCKFGKARTLDGRKKNYDKTFGTHNVNFYPVAAIREIDEVEKAILKKLDAYRIRGKTGRKNEWLQGITAEDVLSIVVSTLGEFSHDFQLLPNRLTSNQ